MNKIAFITDESNKMKQEKLKKKQLQVESK